MPQFSPNHLCPPSRGRPTALPSSFAGAHLCGATPGGGHRYSNGSAAGRLGQELPVLRYAAGRQHDLLELVVGPGGVLLGLHLGLPAGRELGLQLAAQDLESRGPCSAPPAELQLTEPVSCSHRHTGRYRCCTTRTKYSVLAAPQLVVQCVLGSTPACAPRTSACASPSTVSVLGSVGWEG
jgi:hypothetical protein